MTTNNGLLLVDKGEGLTSHDVVAKVRRILGERKIGHAGTLDPMATGLLILAVGPSTRLLRFAQSEAKHYCGAVTFGVATDSLDADGAVTEERPVPELTSDAVATAATSMLGVQQQTPPMVSAIQIDGQRLHELARRGIEVERAPREISVSAFTLAPSVDPRVWTFDVECSVGTYVRVLLSDLANRLGTIGHLSALRRLSSGRHHVRDALTIDALARSVASGESVLAPPSAFVQGLEHVTLSADQQRRMRMGQRVAFDAAIVGDEVAAMDGAGDLVGVLRRRDDSWQPELVLPADDASTRG
jgi:tRNA pseudouridine55 synthase